MAQPLLLAVLTVFCCTVGYSMSTYHASGWAMLIFTAVAIAAMQISYGVGLIVSATRG